MKALVLIQNCAREYSDAAYGRIAKASASGVNWLDLLNDAQRTVVLVRPDAGGSTENITLAAGSRQALPAGALRLLGVTRNMGADGATPGKTIRFVERQSKDDVNPDWHTATASAVIKEVVYDDKKNPLVFYVSPPATGSPRIEVELAKTPTDIVTADVDTADIGLADVYAGPMQAWMLHRAYAIATQSANQYQRAVFYYQSFFNQLGVKIRADMFFAPSAPNMLPSGAQPPGSR